MNCPKCAQENPEGTRFCRKCGATLDYIDPARANTNIVNSRMDELPISRERVARTLLNRIESYDPKTADNSSLTRIFGVGPANDVHHLIEVLNQLLETPGERRHKRLRDGIITACSGLGIALFLRIFLSPLGHAIPYEMGLLLRSVWAVGLVPLFVGLGLILSAFFTPENRGLPADPSQETAPHLQPKMVDSPPSAFQKIVDGASVTDQTTTQLKASDSSRRSSR